jgi:hypothetical protein
MSVRLRFEPRDLWVGVFWRRTYSVRGAGPSGITTTTEVFICLVPMLPLHITHTRER